jgi:hypothetical protein
MARVIALTTPAALGLSGAPFHEPGPQASPRAVPHPPEPAPIGPASCPARGAIRHFYERWGATIAIERRPSVAARLHAAERALADPDPAVRDQAVREAAEIVQAAYREVAGG